MSYSTLKVVYITTGTDVAIKPSNKLDNSIILIFIFLNSIKPLFEFINVLSIYKNKER